MMMKPNIVKQPVKPNGVKIVKYWKKDFPWDLRQVRLMDWIEGYGQILSYGEVKFIRNFAENFIVGGIDPILKVRIDNIQSLIKEINDEYTDDIRYRWAYRGMRNALVNHKRLLIDKV